MCVCVYTVITNGFSSIYCACTILKSRGQRYPCHFLCQRSWVTCGKDIDQGRLIYVPAIVSTVDFLFLFMSCALFLRSRIRVRWKSTARQLRKSGDDYDIIHTLYSPLPHSVCVCVCVVPSSIKNRLSNYGPATTAQQPTLVPLHQPQLSNYGSATRLLTLVSLQQPRLSNHNPVRFQVIV